MLTTTSNISFLSGYQDQRSLYAKDTSNSISKNEDPSKNQNDKVSLSRKAMELQQVYGKKETDLEQNYATKAQRLESEFIQAKRSLEREHSQKKQTLKVDLYA